MKRWLSLLLAAAMVLSLVACGSAGGEPQEPSESPAGTADIQEIETPDVEETQPFNDNGDDDTQGSNILIAYFSWADNAVLDEDVDAVTSPSVIPPGNVQQLASWVQEETGGDLFPLRVTDPYPSDWDACLERANEERGADARPELAEQVENLEQYRKCPAYGIKRLRSFCLLRFYV